MGADGTSTEVGPGTVIGEFEIESQLGEGGMGQVFLGRGPDGPVAVKLMRRELAAMDTHRRRFQREAAAAAAAGGNAHVVSIIGTGEWEGLPYLVQTYVGGGSLRDRLTDHGRMSVDEAVRICGEVAAGLGALHENGLVHRDVKPENILFDTEGVAMISDFGLVKDPGASMLTLPGKTIGSAYYMAPEQVRGEQVVPATDVYALACVTYECLVGTSPFGATSGMKTLWAHLRDPPPNPCDARDDIPDGVGWTIVKALDKEPELRPPTPAMLAMMLRA